MTKIVTATYASAATLKNVHNDLVATGIPEDKIRVIKDKLEVQVMSPDATESEMMEILRRHEPTKITD
jgi:hypothetical protein